MAIWTVLFVEFWKRKQNQLQFDWDTIDFDQNIELVRPEFEINAKYKKINPITGVLNFRFLCDYSLKFLKFVYFKIEEPYVPLKDKLCKIFLSFSVVFFMVIIDQSF